VTVPATWLVYGGGALLIAGVSAAFGLALRPTGPLGRAVARYIGRLDAEARFQFYTIDGRGLFARQLGALVLAVFACVVFEQGYLWLLPALVVIGPILYLRRARKKRVERIEGQLDGWLLIVANMLKTAGGLGDALLASVELIRAPLRQELDRTLKEVHLGATLEDGLRQMAERVKSSILAAVVTLLVVGRRTGGELPALLESSAAALREMARLEGVIRAKTAEGRMQVIVLACIPIGVVVAIHFIDPAFFDPLTQSLLGYALIGGAVVLWLMALASARKILKIDF
jgi:tight adherence protein B